MKYKHIEASREARLWIGQILVPSITFAAGILAIPEVRRAVAAKAEEVRYRTTIKKYKIKEKIKKYRKR